MEELKQLLLDLENDLEERARKTAADDNRCSRIRLMGYLEGVQDMRIALSHYFNENKLMKLVQGSEGEKEDYNTDLIREVVEMHNKVRNMRKEVKALLMLVNQIKIFGREIDAKEFFGKDA